jgi:hypothetical protein
MLWMISILLIVLWLLGLMSGYTLGAWIHVLLILAVIAVILAILRRGTGEPVS